MNKRARKHGGSERTKGWKGKLTNSLWVIADYGQYTGANFLVYLSYLCKRMFKTWTSCYNIIILDEVVMQIISDQLTLMTEPTPSLYSSEVTLNMTSPSDNPAQFSKKENSKLLWFCCARLHDNLWLLGRVYTIGIEYVIKKTSTLLSVSWLMDNR